MRRTWSFLLAVAAWSVLPVSAQVPASPPPTVEEAVVAPPTAPVVVDGVTLFKVRGIAAYPAGQRASDIAARIATIAGDPSIALDSLLVSEAPEASLLLAGSNRVMAVIEADAKLDGVGRHVLAAVYLERIRAAIAAYRRDREPSALANAGGRALAATLALGVALFVVRLVYRRLRRLVESRYRSRVHDLEIHSFQIVRAERLWRGGTAILGAAWVGFVAVAVYVYLQYVLTLFPWTRAAGVSLGGMVAVPLRYFAGGALAIFPNLIFLAILVFLTRSLLRLIRLFFDGVGAGRVALQSFDAEWAAPTYRLVRLLVVGLAVVVA
ncbi:MAG: hypothetical protein EHM24_09075, partial [Acidobacteria bacterium]